MSPDAPTLYQKIDRWIVRITKGISYVSGVCLVVIMLVAFFNVLGEKLRQAGLPVTGIPASTEIIQYLHIPMVFLSAAYVTLDRGHTSIDILSNKFPRFLQIFFEVIGDLCGAGIAAFISWRGWTQMLKYHQRRMMSSVTGVGFPLWPFAFILAFGFGLLALSFLWNITRRFKMRDRENGPPKGEPEEGGAP